MELYLQSIQNKGLDLIMDDGQSRAPRGLEGESGQNLIEYALIAFLIGLAAVTAMVGLSNKIVAAYSSVSSSLSSAL